MSVVIEQSYVRWACGVILWLLLGVLLSPTPRAQAQDCPYTEEEAVADTLDPAGYYPLEMGTVREYVNRTGSFFDYLLRQEVIADTLIDGDLFKKLKEIRFDAEHTTIITEADTSYSYRSVIDGVLFSWTAQEGKTESEIQFFRDFNTCYAPVNRPDGIVVEGAYDSTFTFQPDNTFALAALKKFNFIVPQASESQEYGYGLGFLHFGTEPNVHTTLTYARIDGQEYGTPLDSLFDIRVATKEPAPEPILHLEIYPNPLAGTAHLAFSLPRPGRVTLHVVDMLGRLIEVPIKDHRYPSGRQVVSWTGDNLAAGVYFVRLFVDQQQTTASKLVLTK